MKKWLRYLAQMVVRVLWIFPIKKNRILFFSYNGKGYTCNPKYISKYLNEHHKGDFEIVWAFSNAGEYRFLVDKGVKVIPFYTASFLAFSLKAATSKIVVTNSGFPSFLRKRKSQKFIQTWHGGGAYKKVGMGAQVVENSKREAQRMANIDLFISSCEEFTTSVIRKSFGYEGAVLEKGMPRNDSLFVQSNTRSRIRELYGVPGDHMLILYAPTFRDNFDKDVYSIDISLVAESLQKKNNQTCTVLVRLHYHLSENKTPWDCNDFIIDVSDYPDMQELLSAVDILITDYSSAMWDFSLMYKPCFIYATDIESYNRKRGFYVPIDKWPFPIATTNEELEKNILNFDKTQYEIEVRNHHDQLCSFEKGYATEAVVEYILEVTGDQ